LDTPTLQRIRHTGLYLLPENHPTVPKAVWASDPIPEGFFIEVRPRSSSFKLGVQVFPGTIDRDYRGEIGIGISGGPITSNDKPIAQLVLTPYRQFCAPQAVVRDGGFGSTDAKR
jgi:dUTPase